VTYDYIYCRVVIGLEMRDVVRVMWKGLFCDFKNMKCVIVMYESKTADSHRNRVESFDSIQLNM